MSIYKLNYIIVDLLLTKSNTFSTGYHSSCIIQYSLYGGVLNCGEQNHGNGAVIITYTWHKKVENQIDWV